MKSKEERKYHQIKRYAQKKRAIEGLKVNFKDLLGINEEDVEIVEERACRHLAISCLDYLICCLIFEENPYDAKQKVNEQEILNSWLGDYGINFNTVTKEHIDTLFEIIKRI